MKQVVSNIYHFVSPNYTKLLIQKIQYRKTLQYLKCQVNPLSKAFPLRVRAFEVKISLNRSLTYKNRFQFVHILTQSRAFGS